MKVVVNRCYGGFGLSLEAIKRYHELKGTDIYFYTGVYNNDYRQIGYKAIKNGNPGDRFYCFTKDHGKTFTSFPKDGSFWRDHNIERTDQHLIQVVEELGDKANSTHSKLEIVEIPDGINWEINDYDGMERIEEAHRSW